jgi:hypothetical protein
MNDELERICKKNSSGLILSWYPENSPAVTQENHEKPWKDIQTLHPSWYNRKSKLKSVVNIRKLLPHTYLRSNIVSKPRKDTSIATLRESRQKALLQFALNVTLTDLC